MKMIEFEVGHCVDLLFDEVNAEEMARHVNHHAAIVKSGLIGDDALGNNIGIIDELEEGLQAVEKSCTGCGFNVDCRFVDGHAVTFG